MQDLDAISYQAVSRQESLEESVVKLAALAMELQKVTDQKLVLSHKMNKMITLIIAAFSKKVQSEDHTERLSVAPSGSTTRRVSIEFKKKAVSTPTSNKKPTRGQQLERKGLSESNQGVQDQPIALMMLAGAAEKEASKLSKLPITKRAEKPRKRRKTKQQKAKSENSDSDEDDQEADNKAKTTEVDENEPVYCICGSISNGPMVECDNPDCFLEWFHFNCVNLKKAPKGKW